MMKCRRFVLTDGWLMISVQLFSTALSPQKSVNIVSVNSTIYPLDHTNFKKENDYNLETVVKMHKHSNEENTKECGIFSQFNQVVIQ